MIIALSNDPKKELLGRRDKNMHQAHTLGHHIILQFVILRVLCSRRHFNGSDLIFVYVSDDMEWGKRALAPRNSLGDLYFASEGRPAEEDRCAKGGFYGSQNSPMHDCPLSSGDI